jgi:Rod binding domain-containing protein
MDPLETSIASPGLLAQPATPALGDLQGKDDAKLKKAAKDFESVLLGQVLNSMKDTVGESGLLSGADGEQVQGIFYMYLAQELGTSGGLGLWKQIYASMKRMADPKAGQAQPAAGHKT